MQIPRLAMSDGEFAQFGFVHPDVVGDRVPRFALNPLLRGMLESFEFGECRHGEAPYVEAARIR
jgi:hypothetical protein